jgi:hypothetical protein
MVDITAKHGGGIGEPVKENADLVTCGLPPLSTDIISSLLLL